MAKNELLYHSLNEPGYWTNPQLIETESPDGESITIKGPPPIEVCRHRNIILEDGSILKQTRPVDICTRDDQLFMTMSTLEGDIEVPINSLPGMRVVRGNFANHEFEEDGELLIEINYLKIDTMEETSRRIRPTRIMFGILGDTDEISAQKGGHRAMGESADFYLEGIDTQYDPKTDTNRGLRYFPVWRLGLWGPQEEMAKEFLPIAPVITLQDCLAMYDDGKDGRGEDGREGREIYIDHMMANPDNWLVDRNVYTEEEEAAELWGLWFDRIFANRRYSNGALKKKEYLRETKRISSRRQEMAAVAGAR